MVIFANNDDGQLCPCVIVEPHPERIADLKSIFTDSALASLEILAEQSSVTS